MTNTETQHDSECADEIRQYGYCNCPVQDSETLEDLAQELRLLLKESQRYNPDADLPEDLERRINELSEILYPEES